MKQVALIIAVVAFWLVSALPAQARITRQTTYRYDQVWSTAMRFLRVDNGYKVTEQDKNTGYLLFEYQYSGRTLMASIELFATEKAGFQYVIMGVRIQDMPRYIETVLLNGLERKLRDEYGRPPAAMRVATPSKEKDGEEDKKDKDEDEREESDAESRDGDKEESKE